VPTVHGEVKLSGDPNRLHDFYAALGLATSRASVQVPDFEVFYGSDGEGFDVPFRLVVVVDEPLDAAETRIKALGAVIVDDGFDTSGPYFETRDPAGLPVRVYQALEFLGK
jgi:hypothetical protein